MICQRCLPGLCLFRLRIYLFFLCLCRVWLLVPSAIVVLIGGLLSVLPGPVAFLFLSIWHPKPFVLLFPVGYRRFSALCGIFRVSLGLIYLLLVFSWILLCQLCCPEPGFLRLSQWLSNHNNPMAFLQWFEGVKRGAAPSWCHNSKTIMKSW